MKQNLLPLLCVIFLVGCDSPFQIAAPTPKVVIALYNGTTIRPGDTLTAVIPDLSDNQKSNMKINYTWYRDDKAVALRAAPEHPQSETDEEYTIRADDVRKSIKVKATFMYNESVSASYAVIDINVTTARTFTELRELLAEANNENALEITTTGDFTIPEAISVPANVTLKINSAVTADSNVTVQGKLIAGTGALTVNPSKNIALAAGSAVTVENGGNVYLDGTLDNTNGTIVNNGTVTVNNGAAFAREPVFGTADTGKYIVNQGGRITGFIGAGGIIDNSLPSVIILARGGVELSSGNITVIDDWAIFDTLTVKGLITITPTKRVTGAGNAAKIIVEQAAGVTGGIDSLSLGEGVYTWNGSVWQGL